MVSARVSALFTADASASNAVESMPPLRKMPTGTPATKWC